MKKLSFSLVALISLLLISSCSNVAKTNSGQPDSTLAAETAKSIPTAAPLETPTPQQPVLSTQPYVSPSGAFEINFPQNWSCSENGEYRVDCQSPGEDASVVVRVITTGRQLSQPEFLNLAQAELNFAHNGQRAFNEISRDIGDGSLTVQSTWMAGDAAWQGEDHFQRADTAVYHLNFTVAQDEWPKYTDLFEQVSRSLQPNPNAISENSIYGSTFKYTSPDSLFTIEIPTSWTKFVDITRVQGAQIEQFFSPDQHASIQTVVYRRGALIEQDFKASKTLEIMRTIYGTGFRVSHDKGLSDGRERLDWYVESKQITGISFFDSWGSSLYIFTVLWDNSYQDLYQPVLDRVIESFGHP